MEMLDMQTFTQKAKVSTEMYQTAQTGTQTTHTVMTYLEENDRKQRRLIPAKILF